MHWDDLVEWLLLPPGGLLLLGLIGLLLWRRLAGRVLVGVSLVLFWVLSTPRLAWPLIDAVQWRPALSDQALRASGAQAIVVLGGGRKLNTADYGHTVDEWSMARLRYAARLQRTSGLPIVITGGAPDAQGPAVADLMAAILREELGASVLAVEPDSRNTFENAAFTRPLLEQHGLQRVLLVTQAMHMPRSVAVFQQQGIEVVAAPTGYVGPGEGAAAWLPHARTFYHSYLALHETIGSWWYALRY